MKGELLNNDCDRKSDLIKIIQINRGCCFFFACFFVLILWHQVVNQWSLKNLRECAFYEHHPPVANDESHQNIVNNYLGLPSVCSDKKVTNILLIKFNCAIVSKWKKWQAYQPNIFLMPIYTWFIALIIHGVSIKSL